MHRLASRYRQLSLFGALTLAGCATVAPPAHQPESVSTRFERIRDSVEAAGALDATALDAGALDGDEGSSAPRVRLFIPPAGYTTTNYVDAGFRVTDDAYVLIVTVDRDRRLRVLYPESPKESGFTTKRGSTHLTRFFGGFGSRMSAYASYDLTQRLSPFGAGGVLMAVASDRPLQLQRLSDEDGDWDERQLQQLVYERTLPAATHSVARAVLLTGQEYSTDYITFSGSRTLNAYRSLASGFGECDGFGYGSGAVDPFGLRGYGSSDPFTRFVGFYQRDGQTYARYVSGGGCGAPTHYDVPVLRAMPAPVDTIRRDSTAATTRWAVVKPRSDDAEGTPVAVAGLRFRTRADPVATAPMFGAEKKQVLRGAQDDKRVSVRGGAEASVYRRQSAGEGRLAPRDASSGASTAVRSTAGSRLEPRMQRRAEPRAAVQHREVAPAVTAH
jgi:hypothetical protein